MLWPASSLSALAVVKYATRFTEVRPLPSAQAVVIAIGALPMAGPLVASVKLTVPGEAVTVSDSPKTALKFTVGWLELNWAQEAGVTAISSAKTPKINQALCFVCISPQKDASRAIILS